MIDMDGRAGAMMPSPSDAGSHHPASSVAHGSSARSARPKMLNDVYRLGEELGRGAFGQVFRALDTRTGQHVAVKQLSLEGFKDGDLQGIENEVELLASLRHRNVVKYLGCMRTRSHLHIILEYVENGSLASVIKPSRFGPFPEALVAVTIQQVLQGLAYLHARGVVHRDVKGANILTTKEGVVKLADFGVAAQLAGHEQGGAEEGGDVGLGAPAPSAPAYQTARESNHPVGSPYWMAPEVVEMKSVTPASDVWSVGCLAIELLTGAPPYYELQPMSALFNIVQDVHPPLPPGISAGMRDFLLGCFARDPALRPPARQLLDHPWVTYNRRTLRSTWSRTRGARRGGRGGGGDAEAHATVATVVERMLRYEAEGEAEEEDGARGSQSAGASQAAPPSDAASPEGLSRGRSGARLGLSASGASSASASAASFATAAESLAGSLRGASLRELAGWEDGSRDVGFRTRTPPPLQLSGHATSRPGAACAACRALHADDGEARGADEQGAAFLQRLRSGCLGAAGGWEEAPSCSASGQASALRRGLAATVARQTACLFVPSAPEVRDVVHEAAAAASCATLAGLLQAEAEEGAGGGEEPSYLRPSSVFLDCDGLLALGSALARPSPRLVCRALDLLLALLEARPEAAPAAQAAGLLPQALRRAAPEAAPELRARAGALLELLAASEAGAAGLVAAGGLPRAVALLRPGAEEALGAGLELVRASARALWALLRRAEASSRPLPSAHSPDCPAERWARPGVFQVLCLLGQHDAARAVVGALPRVLEAYRAALRAEEEGEEGAAGEGGAQGGREALQQQQGAREAQQQQQGAREAQQQQQGAREAQQQQQGAREIQQQQQQGAREIQQQQQQGAREIQQQQQGVREAQSFNKSQPALKELGDQLSGKDPARQPPASPSSPASAALPPLLHSPPQLLALLGALVNLLGALACGDAGCRRRLASPDVALALFTLTVKLPASLALAVVCAVRRLAADPATLEDLEAASAVAFLAAQLARGREPSLQAEALAALAAACHEHPVRREQAAVAGAVPFLCALALSEEAAGARGGGGVGAGGASLGSPFPQSDLSPLPQRGRWNDESSSTRPSDAAGLDASPPPSPPQKTVSFLSGPPLPLPPAPSVPDQALTLLCDLAETSPRARAELWTHDVLPVLLLLLRREAQAARVLRALAAWLEADAPRVEARLLTGDALTRLVTLLPAGAEAHEGDEALAATLDALASLLARSPRLAVQLAGSGAASRLVDVLRRGASEPAVLPALRVCAAMLRHHPRGREFASKYRVQAVLAALGGAQSPPPVRQAAQGLLEELRRAGVIYA